MDRIEDLISVIIPIYNREGYLNMCIDSILNQQGVNIEIILIDNGSTDRSTEICEGYTKKYDNVIFVHQAVNGVSTARNTGLKYAKGDFIVFVDSDDYLPKDSLKNLLNIQKEYPVDVVIGNYAEYTDKGNFIKSIKIPSKYCNRILSNREVCELLYFSEKNHLLVVCWGKLYKRKVWDNLRFEDDIPYAEDQFLFPKLIEKCKSIYLTDKVVYNQVFSETSLVRAAITRRNLFHSQGIGMVIDYLIKQGYYDIALYKFGVGTRHFIAMKKVLKDDECQQEIKSQYADYKKLAFQLFPHVDIKNKLRFILFFINLDLYGRVRERMGDK